MAATDEMVAIALKVKPDMVTLVPEHRQEVTTEGGLDVVAAVVGTHWNGEPAPEQRNSRELVCGSCGDPTARVY
jgi:hypothetical protein